MSPQPIENQLEGFCLFTFAFLLQSFAMKSRIFLFLLLATLLSACSIHSLNPLYTSDTLTSLDSIVGNWESSKGESWEFQKAGNQSYTLVYTDNDDNKALFQVHFVRLNNEFFIDFYPGEVDGFDMKEKSAAAKQIDNQEDLNNQPSVWKNAFFVYHLVPFHTFAKVVPSGDSFVIKMFDRSFLEEKMKSGEVTLKHEIKQTESDAILLTAGSADLQKYVMRYSNTASAFTDGDLVLKKSF